MMHAAETQYEINVILKHDAHVIVYERVGISWWCFIQLYLFVIVFMEHMNSCTYNVIERFFIVVPMYQYAWGTI